MNEFKCGRTSTCDASRSGRPIKAVTPEIDKVHDIVLTDRRMKVRELVEATGISHGTVISILGMEKLSARWVPRLLTVDHKRDRVTISKQYLEMFDETWIHYFTPETKEQSKQWTSPSELAKKAKTMKSARKVIGTSDVGLFYISTNAPLSGFVDADWRGNLVDRRSHTVTCFIWNGGPITWDSRKQRSLKNRDKHVSTVEIARELGIDHKTVLNHLHKAGYKKKLDVWVPHELSVKMDRINICDTLLKWNEIEPFLKRMITDDEKWITYDNRTRKKIVDKGRREATIISLPQKWQNIIENNGAYLV
ncbi:SETMR methyltransferase, partial [Acromyrmex insinuator]